MHNLDSAGTMLESFEVRMGVEPDSSDDFSL